MESLISMRKEWQSRPLIIVGNGPSSNFNDYHLVPANPCIFRLNMFFLEKDYFFGKNVDGYFSAINREYLNDLLYEIGTSTKEYIFNLGFSPLKYKNLSFNKYSNKVESLEFCFKGIVDHWEIIAKEPKIARKMFTRPLPTIGMQALATACVLGFKEIHLVGFDLYQSKKERYSYQIPTEIKNIMGKEHYSPGFERAHSLEVELDFLNTIKETFKDINIYSLSTSSPISRYLPISPKPIKSINLFKKKLEVISSQEDQKEKDKDKDKDKDKEERNKDSYLGSENKRFYATSNINYVSSHLRSTNGVSEIDKIFIELIDNLGLKPNFINSKRLNVFSGMSCNYSENKQIIEDNKTILFVNSLGSVKKINEYDIVKHEYSILIVHESPAHFSESNLNSLSHYSFFIPIMNLFKHVVFVSRVCMESWEKLGFDRQGTKSHYFPNSSPMEVEINRINQSSKERIRDTKDFIKPNDFVISIVASIQHRKGQDILVDAALSILRKIPSAKFIFVGKEVEPIFANKLKKKIARMNLESKVEFLGYRNDALGIIKSSDVLLLPSRAEAMPLTVLEAMALKTPVVASNVDGVPELVVNGQNGFLFQIDKPEQMVDHLNWIYKNAFEVSKLVDNAYLDYQQKFNLNAFKSRYIGLLKEVLIKVTEANIDQMQFGEERVDEIISNVDLQYKINKSYSDLEIGEYFLYGRLKDSVGVDGDDLYDIAICKYCISENRLPLFLYDQVKNKLKTTGRLLFYYRLEGLKTNFHENMNFSDDILISLLSQGWIFHNRKELNSMIVLELIHPASVEVRNANLVFKVIEKETRVKSILLKQLSNLKQNANDQRNVARTLAYKFPYVFSVYNKIKRIPLLGKIVFFLNSIFKRGLFSVYKN